MSEVLRIGDLIRHMENRIAAEENPRDNEVRMGLETLRLLYECAVEVTGEYPSSPDNHWYNRPRTLDERIQRRREKTAELLELLKGINR